MDNGSPSAVRLGLLGENLARRKEVCAALSLAWPEVDGFVAELLACSIVSEQELDLDLAD